MHSAVTSKERKKIDKNSPIPEIWQKLSLENYIISVLKFQNELNKRKDCRDFNFICMLRKGNNSCTKAYQKAL